MEFDKKTILAFLLIGVIFIIMQTDFYQKRFLPPPQKKPLPEAVEDRQTGAQKPVSSEPEELQRPIIESVAPAEKGSERRSVYSSLVATADQEEEIRVETNLYSAVFSTRGATVKRFVLKEYSISKGGSVQIIGGDGVGNLGILLPTSEDTLDTSELLFKTTRKGVSLSQMNSDVLSFVVKLDESRQIKKTYTFYRDRYDIDLRVEFRNMNDLVEGFSYLLTWRSGLESTEPDFDKDMQNAKAFTFQGDKETFSISKKVEEKTMDLPTDWVGIRTKYFAVAAIPQNVQGRGVKFFGEPVPRAGESVPWKKYGFDLQMPFEDQRTKTDNYKLYFGPLDYDIVKSYDVGLEQIVDLGPAIFRPFGKFVLWSFRLLHGIIPNYGWVIVVFSILIKVLLWPLTRKSYQSMKEMQSLQPVMQEINEKYKDNPQKKQEATMKLYKEYGINPLGGCVPMLLQMPLLYAMFNVFRSTIDLRGAAFIWWITDLARPDTIATLPFSLPLYGNTLNILPLFMGITMFIQQKISMKDPKQKAMVYFMPIFLTLMFNSFPSGLNLYYALFNLLSIFQEKLVPHKTRSPEELKEKKAAKTKKRRVKYDYRGGHR